MMAMLMAVPAVQRKKGALCRSLGRRGVGRIIGPMLLLLVEG